MTSPLPALHEDPSIVKGQKVKAEWPSLRWSIVYRTDLTNLQIAQQVVVAWNACNDELARLYNDLQDRRRTRLDALENIVPLGPPIQPNASQADQAVLHQAFRAALEQARNATPSTQFDNNAGGGNIAPLGQKQGTLEALLADAEKFDDDVLRRAVLTAAFEAGRLDIVKTYTDQVGITAQLEEFQELQRAIAGQGIAGQWNYTALSPIPAAPEVDELPRLEAADQVARQERIRHDASTRRIRMQSQLPGPA